MDKHSLFKKFNEALTWNGLLFGFNKISKTLISFFLYLKLSTSEFSAWATIYSLIFIGLLWFDFGLSRSVPQFAFYFSQNQIIKKWFFRKLILGKMIISCVITLIAVFYASTIARLFSLQDFNPFFTLGALLFLMESIKSIIQSLFYSYFWNKRFNLLEGISLALYTTSILIALKLRANGRAILYTIFITHIASLILLVILALFLIEELQDDVDYQDNHALNQPKLIKGFLTHCTSLWGLLAIQSLSERNFLLPLFTYTLGAPAANLFKIANDAALLFQRFVLKTIGTSSYALLTQLDDTPQYLINQKKKVHLPRLSALRDGVSLVTTRILNLTIPLLGILAVGYVISAQSYDSRIITLFAFLLSAYLLQIIFTGYDTLLEVKQNYSILFLSAIPYLGILAVAAFLITHPESISLMMALILIHLFRSISLLFRTVYATHLYGLSFPKKEALQIGSITLLAALMILLLFKIIS